LCVRYFTRPGGSIITQDCPRPLRSSGKRLVRVAAVATFAFGFIGLAGMVSACPADTRARIFFSDLYGRVLELLGQRPLATMGDVTTTAKIPSTVATALPSKK
jgi:hypothetical protein